MLIASVCIGDSLVQVIHVFPIVRSDKVMYQFIHRDLPSGVEHVIPSESENDMLMTFAAWIASDLPNLGDLDKYRQRIPDQIRP